MKIRLLSLLCLVLAGCASIGNAERNPIIGHWDGTISYDGVPTEIRLTTARLDGALRAEIDLPELVYAEQSVAIEEIPGGAIVELPFGLGRYELRPEGDGVSSVSGRIVLNLSASKIPFEKRKITVASGDRLLEGFVYEPVSVERKSIGIVVAGGATANGAELTWETQSWCNFFVRLGVTCLVYARPDLLEKETQSEFSVAARDLSQMVLRLANDEALNLSKVGVVARSQGVWIAAKATEIEERIGFLIFSGGPATTPAQQELISLPYRLRRAGYDTDAIENAEAYLRLYFYVAHTQNGWSLLEYAIASVKDEDWSSFVDQPRSLDDLKWYHRNGNFDPTYAYSQIQVPTFALWGSEDDIVPPEIHRSLLDAKIAEAADFQSFLFDGGNHRGEIDFQFSSDGTPRWFGMAPGLLNTYEEIIEELDTSELAEPN